MAQERRLNPIQLDLYQPLREVIYETLREAIRSGVLEAGERLMEIQIAEELGVSRTPVREATRRLEAEGLVVMIPRRGTYVADMSLRDVSDVFEIREALEALAVGLAAKRITEDEMEELERMMVEFDEVVTRGDVDRLVELDIRFHAKIYEASRNVRLVSILSNLREQMTSFRMTSMSVPGRMKKTMEEHRAIVEALGERDAKEAAKVIRFHLSEAEGILLKEAERRQQK